MAKKPDKIELRPDGYERFRLGVQAAAKAGPKPAKPKRKPSGQSSGGKSGASR